MSKTRSRTVYVCNSCGNVSPKWQGRCPECGQWNTYVETVEQPAPTTSGISTNVTSRPRRLKDVSADDIHRIHVPMPEVNRVLGGGIVSGSLVLIGGDPGVGKSTLLLQLCCLLCDQLSTVLYVSGEESIEQIRLRASRLGRIPDNLWAVSETSLEAILNLIEEQSPSLVIIDSIQTIYSENIESAAGSVSQVRDCTMALMLTAKSRNIPMFIVGHVTKEGAIAGPKVLEHIVDTVLYLEGDRAHQYRLLRAAKNRYGSTNEVGVFEMTQEGLIDVPNPSEVFLSERPEDTVGSSIAVLLEGSRPLLVELQALAIHNPTGIPRRTSNGLDYNRLLLLIAVLTKRVGLKLADQDIYVNVVGGLRLDEPSSDLAVAVAIASSALNRPVREDTIFVGEVGLSGELRSVPNIDRRISEAASLGFKRAVCAPVKKNAQKINSIQIVQAKTLAEAIGKSLYPPAGKD
ncbi:DNA repair protein RadA [Thermobaculum terrenum ATCC BAA-798]|uniref:DNA repair protein RadA n=1 Tax=Thermobaculum terrenum (strain ATCC BAA-798 / CCMEE 7001 / YNP1) TaxID=525904 RepID=D1CBU0_THET1|nr:DNA repair protein RadA [Thermobaculum terrenum]ACZ42255.1 DNA repair protein RadA [Thermobaculum terrenum ATCC BAA-798]